MTGRREFPKSKDGGSEDRREGDRRIEEFVNEQKGPRPSVLIVEDNPVNQKVAAGLFDKLGCQVYIAESGTRALQLVQEYDVDVIMMDWELPGMDGFETARAIRELERSHLRKRPHRLSKPRGELGFTPCAHIPIVGMTAHGNSERDQSGWEHVMDDCLAKPIRLHDLANVLTRWMGSKAQAIDDQASSGDSNLETDLSVLEVVSPLHTVRSAVDYRKSSPPTYDISAAVKSLDGDEALLYTLFQIFLDTAPNLIHGMREAIAVEDRSRLQRHTHQLKGALFALNAGQQALVAERLEAEVTVAPFSELQRQFGAMECEVEALMTLFRDALVCKK